MHDNSAAIFRYDADTDLTTPQPGPLLVLLGGFIDAGHIQRTLTEHLLGSGEAEVIAAFDVDQLLDYRGRRPVMIFDTSRWESYDEPALLLHRLTDRNGSPYYLLAGPEPDYQWERVVRGIRTLIDDLGVTLTVSTHGIPMNVPHTRPVGTTVHATDPQLIGEARSPFGRVQVPASISALLELRLGEQGRDAMGVAVHVPHYLLQAQWAEGALTALNALVDLTGLNLPNDDLVAAAAVNTREIAQELANNEEAAQVVHALEQHYDTAAEGASRPSLLGTESADLPSADELGADFEEFLRNNPPS